MGSEWLKNMCGISLTDQQMERVPHSTTELGIHVTTKFVQAFGLIGTLMVGPIFASTNVNTRNWEGMKESMTSKGTGGLILGMAVGPILTMYLMRNEDDYKIWDRCYRLRNSKNQVLVDQESVLGAVVGAGVGSYTGNGAVFGGLLGMSGGIILATIYNSTKSKK